MAKSAIDLCSQALVRLGAEPISSFDDETAEADVSAALYPGVRDAVLSSHPWGFATGQEILERLTAVPIADFAHAYKIPNDLLRVISAGDGAGKGLRYRIHENRLHTDAESVTLTHIFRPDESAWPGYFDELMVRNLMAAFAEPITASTSAADRAEKSAARYFMQAKLIDAQQDTPEAIEDSEFALIAVRG